LWCKDNNHDKIDRTNLWDGATTLETNLDILNGSNMKQPSLEGKTEIQIRIVMIDAK
jgi:hypothetical protein